MEELKLHDLDEAIIHSITERSLAKINNYLKCSGFGVNRLNSKTLSILLRSLEKYKSNEDNIVNVKCVLICLQKLFESKQDSKNWDDFTENISKICEACFCIALKLESKELLEFNIKVLDEIIEKNNKLTDHIFQYLLEPCLTALCRHCKSFDYPLLIQLANITSSLCENTSRMKRNEVVPMVTYHLNILSNSLTLCGDYEIQAALVEVLARCKPSIISPFIPKGPTGHLFSSSALLSEQFNKYSFFNFDSECRMFLNVLNESLGDKRQVYSVPCICVVHNFIRLKKPNDPSYKLFWVDFNIASKRISFYHELPDTYLSIESVSFQDVKHVMVNNSVCISKYAKQQVDSVKVEFSLCSNSLISQGRDDGPFRSLKLYCRKTQFDILNRVLSIVFPTMKEMEINPKLKADIGLLYSIPVQMISSTAIKEVSNPKKNNTTPSSSEFGLAQLKQSTQQNIKPITTSSTEKQVSKIKFPFNESSTNVYEAHSNCESYPNIVGTKMPCKDRQKITPNEVICENDPILVQHDTGKLCELPKKPSSINTCVFNTHITKRLKHNADSQHVDNKECRVKRKRLYSIDKEDKRIKSINLSSQDGPLNLKKRQTKTPTTEGKYNEKNCFWNKNKCMRKSNPIHTFTDEISSDADDYISFLSSKTLNKINSSSLNKGILDSKVSDKATYSSKRDENEFLTNITLGSDKLSNCSSPKATLMKNSKKNPVIRQNSKRLTKKLQKGKELPVRSFQYSSDSDYKPSCHIQETDYNVHNKRVLRKRKNPFNKIDVTIDDSSVKKIENITNDKTGPCSVEANMDFPVPRKIKKYEFSLGTSKSVNNNLTTANSDHLPTSYIHESNYTISKELKESQDFLGTVILSKFPDPTQDETRYDIEVNANQPEDTEMLPEKAKTYDTACTIENFDMISSKNLANDDELSANQSKLKSIKSSTEHPIHLWNMAVDDMPVGIKSDSFLCDMSLNQSTYQVGDILELSKKSGLVLKNNIESSLIQSQAKRRQHRVAYDEQLRNTSNSILFNINQLEFMHGKLNNLKASLDQTLDSQHTLIIKIQSEMSNLKEAKEQSLKDEAEIDKSETIDIMNIIKSFCSYVRRLLLTSFRNRALTR